VSNVSAPACTNGPPLQSLSVAQKNKPSTMLSSNVQSIDLPWTAWPDGSGRWDYWMVAQHLPRDLVQPSSGLNNYLKRRSWNTKYGQIKSTQLNLWFFNSRVSPLYKKLNHPKSTITGSSFVADCLRNLLPGYTLIFLQWFKLTLIIQQ